MFPKFARPDTLCSLQTREGEAETGITPSQTFHTDKRDFSHPDRLWFWEGKRQRPTLGCHSHLEASRAAGEQSCPHPVTAIHPSTPPGILGLLLPERGVGWSSSSLFPRIPPQCRGCLSVFIPYSSCSASSRHQETEWHQTKPAPTLPHLSAPSHPSSFLHPSSYQKPAQTNPDPLRGSWNCCTPAGQQHLACNSLSTFYIPSLHKNPRWGHKVSQTLWTDCSRCCPSQAPHRQQEEARQDHMASR